jgi:hypothetical protein
MKASPLNLAETISIVTRRPTLPLGRYSDFNKESYKIQEMVF